MKSKENHLNKEISEAITKIIEATRKYSREALDQAFAEAAVGARRGRPRVQGGAPKNNSLQRRTSQQIKKIADDFLQVVIKHPGMTMAQIKIKLGVERSELVRPAALLKSQGKVKIVGERNSAEYFPLYPKD